MKTRLLTYFLLLALTYSCKGQGQESKNSSIGINCNRNTYGTKKYIKDLPKYICIPEGFIIDDYIRVSNLNQDNINDFIAIKYNFKEEDQIDGDTTFWDFYLYNYMDSIYILKYKLNNLVPPFIKDISNEYLAENPLAENIFNLYPRRLSHNLSFIVIRDTIKLSYKFDDTYGKTFVFIFNSFKQNWYLQNIEYFLGELPMYWWQNSVFYYPLKDEILVLETIKPRINVSIEKFSLLEAFKYRGEEVDYLSSNYINNIDEKTATSIIDIEFNNNQKINLPKDWNY